MYPTPILSGDGLWHEVAVTFSQKNRQIIFFMDGHDIRQLKPVPEITVSEDKQSSGSATPHKVIHEKRNYFVGWISQVCFYQRVLTNG